MRRTLTKSAFIKGEKNECDLNSLQDTENIRNDFKSYTTSVTKYLVPTILEDTYSSDDKLRSRAISNLNHYLNQHLSMIHSSNFPLEVQKEILKNQLKHKDEFVNFYRQCLKDPTYQYAALYGLVQLCDGSEETVRQVVEIILQKGDLGSFYLPMAQILFNAGSNGEAQIKELLKSPIEETQFKALHILSAGWLDKKKFIKDYIRLLSSNDTQVRYQAFSLLGETNQRQTTEVYNVVVSGLTHENRAIRIDSALSLLSYTYEDTELAKKALNTVLLQTRKEDPDLTSSVVATIEMNANSTTPGLLRKIVKEGNWSPEEHLILDYLVYYATTRKDGFNDEVTKDKLRTMRKELEIAIHNRNKSSIENSK